MGQPRMPPPRPPPTVPLAHRDFGGAGEPPFVILHGMLGSSRNWQTAGRDLAGARRTFALDLRNHGASPHAPSMAYDALAADVVAWLDARGIERAELVGHSLGGKVAMVAACRNPSRVARLVVVDIAPKPYSWPQRRAEFAAMLELDLAGLKSRADAERRLEAHIPSWPMRKFAVANLERAPGGGWRWLVNLPVLAAAMPELERQPLGPDESYGGPALFIAGARSGMVQPADAESIHRHFPAARLLTIPGTGHNPHVEAREAFVRAVCSGG